MNCRERLFDFLNNATYPGGWGLRGHLSLLYALPVMLDAKVILELGTGEGNSTLSFVSAVQVTKGIVYSVDIDKERQDKVKEIFREEMARNEIMFIHADSIEYVNQWNGKQIDFLLCDTDHAYKRVYGELTTWGKYMRKRGIMTVHDTDHEVSPTYKAARDYAEQTNKGFINLPHSEGLALIFERKILHKIES